MPCIQLSDLLCLFNAWDETSLSEKISIHIAPFLWRSLLRALYCESHASGSAACNLVTRSSEPPQSTRQLGNGATCSVCPNFKRPLRKRIAAFPTIDWCQNVVSVLAGISITMVCVFPQRLSSYALVTQWHNALPYGGLQKTGPNQGRDTPSSP